MALICEDLAEYGAVLIPPFTGSYIELLMDIEQSVQNRPKGSPPVEHDALRRISEHEIGEAAILLNRATVPIDSVAYIWFFREEKGRLIHHQFFPGTSPSLILPFELRDRGKKRRAFWNTIFPDSKRLLTADGHWYGDNTDVRAPTENELWDGGWFSANAARGAAPGEPVKLTLDGVFFGL